MTSSLVQKLTGVRDLKKILETTVKDLGESFNAETCQIMLSNPLDPNVTSICEFRASKEDPLSVVPSVSMPLLLHGRMLGAVSLARYNEVSLDEINAIRVILGELSDIIRHAQINDVVQRDTFRDTFLVEIGNFMAYSLGIGDALFMVVNILGKVLHASRCLFICTDDTQAGWKCYEYWEQDKIRSCQEYRWPTTNSPLIAQTLLSSSPLRVFEGQANSYVSPVQEELQFIGVKSLLGVALRSQSATHGCVILQQCDYRRAWTRNEVDMVQNVADKVAEALVKLPAEKLAREPIMQLHQRIVTEDQEGAAKTVSVRNALKGALGQQAIPSARKTSSPPSPPKPVAPTPPLPLPSTTATPAATPTQPKSQVQSFAPPSTADAGVGSMQAKPVAKAPDEPSSAKSLGSILGAAARSGTTTSGVDLGPPMEPKGTTPPPAIAPAPQRTPTGEIAAVVDPYANLDFSQAKDGETSVLGSPGKLQSAMPGVTPPPSAESVPAAATVSATPAAQLGESSGTDAVSGTRLPTVDQAPGGQAEVATSPVARDKSGNPGFDTIPPGSIASHFRAMQEAIAPSLSAGAASATPSTWGELADAIAAPAASSPWAAPPGVESVVAQVDAPSTGESAVAGASYGQQSEVDAIPTPKAGNWGNLDGIPSPKAQAELGPTPKVGQWGNGSSIAAPGSEAVAAPAAKAGGAWGDLDAIAAPKQGNWGNLDSIPTPAAAAAGGLSGMMVGKARASASPGGLLGKKGQPKPPPSEPKPPSPPVVELDEKAAEAKIKEIVSSQTNETTDFIFATPGLSPRVLGRIDGWVSDIEKKDRYVGGHARAVAEYAVAIARESGLSAKDLDVVRQAALLHDIGKLGSSAAILQKRDEDLTDPELIMKMKHPLEGADLLESFPDLKHLASIVRAHHEEYNGNGYPAGLKAEEIPVAARIICVADSYHSLTSKMTYGEGMTAEEAREAMLRGAGQQWDPNFVQALLQAIDSNKVPAKF